MTQEIHDFFESYLDNNVGELSDENRAQITSILENKKVKNSNLLPDVQLPGLTQYRKMARMADEDTEKTKQIRRSRGTMNQRKEESKSGMNKVSKSNMHLRDLAQKFGKIVDQDLGLEQDMSRGQEQENSRDDE